MRKYTLLLAAAFLLSAASAYGQSELLGEAVNQNFAAEIQPGLLEQIANPETSRFDFMLICKRLGVYGTPEAATALEPWLANPEKSQSARNALVEMPFDEALAVLRRAVSAIDEPVLKAGAIESLGMRRDKGAIDVILPLLDAENETVAETAFFALARIADPSYRENLTKRLSADDTEKACSTADLALMYGEFLRRDGNEADAVAVYKAVAACSPRPFHREAACYQILLNETEEARALAAEWLVGDDAIACRAALRAAQFVKSDSVCAVLTAAYEKAPEGRKAAIIAGIGDQKNPAAQGLLMSALESDNDAIKTAALGALKAFSDADTMNRMIDTALAGDGSLLPATLAVIERFDDRVDAAIVKLLDADAARQKIGAELVAAHKIALARPKLTELAKSDSEELRNAALTSLGYVADTEAFAFLCGVYAETGSDAALAGMKAACGVSTDKTAAAEILAQTADKLAGRKELRLNVFKTFAVLGGMAARNKVEAAAVSNDLEAQDLATQALGTWMNPDAAQVLLRLANAPGYKYANRALRGALRLAKQFAMPEWVRAGIVRDALASKAFTDKEKELVDAIVKQYKLDLSAPETDEQKQIRNIEIVDAKFGIANDPEHTVDATDKVRDAFTAAGALRVELKDGFNGVFGDPAPGKPKKLYLTVRYYNDGTTKTVEIPEIGVITLPAQ